MQNNQLPTQGHIELEDKAKMPNWVPYLDRAPFLERYVVRCGSNNGYQKDMCSKDIELHAQIMRTTLGSIINMIWGGPTWPLNEHKTSHFDDEEDNHMSSRLYEESVHVFDLDLLTITY